MRTRNGRILTGVLGVVAVGVVAAGSVIGLRYAGGNHPSPATSATVTVPSPTPSTAPSAPTSEPPSTSGSTPPSATHSLGVPPNLVADIGGLPADATLTPGGDWLQFTVTITNGTGSTAAQIAPVLSLGHCTCSDPNVGQAPAGQMQVLDPATGTWHDIQFDAEGSGADFQYVAQVPAADLAAGASRSVTYRIRIDAHQSAPIHNGTGTIDVTIVRNPGPSAQTITAQATAPVRYTTG